MLVDFIQKAAEEIVSFLEDEFKIKFTVKFNGEFFIVNPHEKITINNIKNDLFCISDITISDTKITIAPADAWIKECIVSIDESECESTNLIIYSQVVRLKKQIEYDLVGGRWNQDMYDFARHILYMLHTKSSSIRLNIVKRCAKEYNKMQRELKIPVEIVKGYKNALCQINL